MKTLQFKCTLLSDIILNQKSATEGANSTLDFIPGSNFLGIAAGTLYANYKDDAMKTWTLFHSGQVRFGDAHPANKLADGSYVRSLKIPADMFYPKLQKMSDVCYIMHRTDNKAEKIKELQLKQCRNGFYDFTGCEVVEAKTEKTFAIKSAHDKDKRISADKQMYGYQSLDKGLEMLFEVEIKDDSLEADIVSALEGEKRVGRSRSAQYGLVDIKLQNFKTVESKSGDGDITVYADSRLIFIDKNTGMPVFEPTIADLGLEAGEIDWKKSQIRTFQYSPWNFKRQCYDTDRCGIEKGSVFVIKNGKTDGESKYVGAYTNEGFGKVIYNPSFLDADSEGKAKIVFPKEKKLKKQEAEEIKGGTPLLSFLAKRKKEEEIEFKIYSKVNTFVQDNAGKFKGDQFASQWGKIRSMASMQADSSIKERLVGTDDAYLRHGVAADKWKLRKRDVLLVNFIDEIKAVVDDEKYIRLALVNLAAEMAKKCRKED